MEVFSKMIKIAATFLLVFAIFCGYVGAEVIQTIDESIFRKKETTQDLNCDQLKDIQNIKNKLISFIKADTKTKSKALSSRYKSIFKDVEKELLLAFNKEVYSRIDIRELKYQKNQKVIVKANLYWEDEGYSGVQTFYFIFTREAGEWFIDWLVF